MVKIIEFNINEILLEERACSDLLRKACTRSPVTMYHVTGMCSTKNKVFVILEQCTHDIILPEYRFALLSSLSVKEIGSELSARYHAGFTTIGSFIVENELWALFAYDETKKNSSQ